MKKILRFKEIDYVIRYPEGFSEEEKYPLLFYIHGAGGTGRDIDLIYNHSFFSATDKYNLKVISIVLQCYEDSWLCLLQFFKMMNIEKLIWQIFYGLIRLMGKSLWVMKW